MSEVKYISGSKTSHCPRLDLLPYRGLCRVAARFQKDETNYGHDNWRKGLMDKAYIIERAGRVLNHTALLIAKLEGHVVDDGDDDAAAIAWGGLFLCEAVEALAAAERRPNCSTCGGTGAYTCSTETSTRTICPACNGDGKSRV
jgi:hypothetical protein